MNIECDSTWTLIITVSSQYIMISQKALVIVDITPFVFQWV